MISARAICAWSRPAIRRSRRKRRRCSACSVRGVSGAHGWPHSCARVSIRFRRVVQGEGGERWLVKRCLFATTVAKKSTRARAQSCASRTRTRVAVRNRPISATTAPRRCRAAQPPAAAAGRSRLRRPESRRARSYKPRLNPPGGRASVGGCRSASSRDPPTRARSGSCSAAISLRSSRPTGSSRF